jgi:hypothetical protein
LISWASVCSNQPEEIENGKERYAIGGSCDEFCWFATITSNWHYLLLCICDCLGGALDIEEHYLVSSHSHEHYIVLVLDEVNN